MKHLIDLDDYSIDELERLVQLALEIEADPSKYYGKMSGKILGTLFYEPSTRTQISFQTAMLKLGGQLVGFDNPNSSSVAKGENLKDTIKVISNYADIISIRHPQEGSAKAASLVAECPIINAGDGGHLHPTQTLTDLVTLMDEKGRLDNLAIGLCGDLKYGRTVHSLIKAMSHFKGNKFILISTPMLTIPGYLKKIIMDSECEYEEVSTLEEAMPMLDVLYMTRIQQERFEYIEEYVQQKSIYCLDMPKLENAKADLSILHPLPRVDEIDIAVDDDPRAIYFKQAKHGVYARMALILYIFSCQDSTIISGNDYPDKICSNNNCVTHSEKYLKHYYREYDGKFLCSYCDSYE